MNKERMERLVLAILESTLPPSDKVEAIKATYAEYRAYAERQYW